MALLLERHRGRLYAMCTALLGVGPETTDVVQDVFLVASASIGSLSEPEAVGPWLAEIARNQCRRRQPFSTWPPS
jgi:DNA-directed RNA polymerase specialized sigma24 family protein